MNFFNNTLFSIIIILLIIIPNIQVNFEWYFVIFKSKEWFFCI
jgi:hypothetical protein